VGQVPKALRDAHYPGAKGLGHGAGYRYPHDDPRGVLTQQYAPDDIVERDYYRPVGHGTERDIVDRLPRLRRIVRGTTSGTIETDDALAGPTDDVTEAPDASAATTSAREERA
jgi:putative ATPase